MSSPGGRIEIRVDPDMRGFAGRLGAGLSSAAASAVTGFANALKVGVAGAAIGITAAAVVAANDTLKVGIEYEGQLNTLQAVSQATEAQMRSVSETAKTLGSDLELPATSAADAAAVMTELAKANFSVDEAQQAARGSLQLAAAAQIGAAQAATIQANAINAYGLAATDAGRVSDVLANAANASSAEITDVADALAQASAVAASAGISIEDTASVLGILANNGIKGSDAGTLLKSALLALQSPSKQAQAAMGELGLSAYDAEGNFVGLRAIFEQLQVAQGSMTQQQYEMATSTLFGSDAARLAGIAAKEGGEGFDVMSGAIGRQGAAAEVAAAKARGLGGAIEGFKSQWETIQINLFEKAAPEFEAVVRYASERLPVITQVAGDVIRGLTGPQGFGQIGLSAVNALEVGLIRARGWSLEYGDEIRGGINAVKDYIADVAGDMWEGISDGAQAARPGVESLAGTARDVLGAALQLASRIVEELAANGDTLGESLGRVAEVASEIGQASLPLFNAGMAVAGPVVDAAAGSLVLMAGALDAIGPVLPIVLAGVIGFKVVAGIWGAATAAALAYSAALGRVASATAFATFAMTGSQTAGARAGTAVAALGRALPVVGVAAIAMAAQVQSANQRVDEFAQSLLNGGKAAQQAARDAKEAASSGFGEFIDAMQFGDQTSLGEQMSGLDDEQLFAEAKQRADELYDAMSPLGQAQQDVTKATNDLSLAQQENGVNSAANGQATRALATAKAELERKQRDVEAATESATEALVAQAQQALGAASADLQLRQARLGVQQAQDQYNQTLADGNATAADRTAAEQALEGAYLSAAQAAAAKAIADNAGKSETEQNAAAVQAQLAVLEEMAGAAGGTVPAAITQLIGSLQASAGAGAITSAQMRDLGLSVVGIPNSKFVDVKAPTGPQMEALRALGVRTETLPDGNVRIFADTGPAAAALAGIVRDYQGRTIYMQARISGQAAAGGNYSPGGIGGGRAMGGLIRGPGTWTSDSILTPTSDGEYVLRSAMTARVGVVAMDAMNRGDWATAAARLSQLADRQSLASMAAAAGGRAAVVAGRYAAGGYVNHAGGGSSAPAANVNVAARVFIDGRELRGMVRTEAVAIADERDAAAVRDSRSWRS